MLEWPRNLVAFKANVRSGEGGSDARECGGDITYVFLGVDGGRRRVNFRCLGLGRVLTGASAVAQAHASNSRGVLRRQRAPSPSSTRLNIAARRQRSDRS